MRDAILEWGEIEVELGAASKAPEEVRIDGGEMIEEPFATGELVVGNPVVLEELLLREPPKKSASRTASVVFQSRPIPHRPASASSSCGDACCDIAAMSTRSRSRPSGT